MNENSEISTEELIKQANEILRGKGEDALVVYDLARELAARQYLDYACRLADHITDDASLAAAKTTEIRQKHALWTSKNPDESDDNKHDRALEILGSLQNVAGGSSLENTADPETLGIAGGIAKRKWFIDGLDSTLEKSLKYYMRGSESGINETKGYPEINAAFVLDLLNHVDGVNSDERVQLARDYREKALTLETLAEQLKGQRWYHETLAEAHFGLGHYSKATEALKLAYQDDDIEPWEIETTARQFAWLARIRQPDINTVEEFNDSEAWAVLRDVYGSQANATAGSLFGGKLGLALSGGGFRASFYHIGVLAALAEKDMLRHVEVLSCVSGGSILGAHYYLEMRNLLEKKQDDQIEQKDYIALVDRLAKDFLAGVQKNIRMRVASRLKNNLLMMFKTGYTRTSRLGELYEKHLYARIPDDKKRKLRELKIEPCNDENLNPKYENWKRLNKLPILILNCTTLNTGHNWQFTTSWMGEPPTSVDTRIDTNERLRRMYLETEAPDAHRDISIGAAAAASSCVPGLFTPLELRDLYPNRTVRLVDGGVHDNQGIFGLLDQNCNVMLVSDASGQMPSQDNPKDSALGVLLRASGVLSSRIRSATYREIDTRKKTGRLKDLLFLHLKQDLDAEAVDWVDCNNPKSRTNEEEKEYFQCLASAGILKRYQKYLSNIRTDLDSFSDKEAFSLMTSGYLMTKNGLRTKLSGFARSELPHNWYFLSVKDELADSAESDLDKWLQAGSSTFFKIWRLSRPLLYTSRVVVVCVLLLLGYIVWGYREAPFISVGGLLSALSIAIFGVVAGRFGLQKVFNLVNYQKSVNQVGTGVILSVVGFLSSWLHLSFFDKLFLKKGKK